MSKRELKNLISDQQNLPAVRTRLRSERAMSDEEPSEETNTIDPQVLELQQKLNIAQEELETGQERTNKYRRPAKQLNKQCGMHSRQNRWLTSMQQEWLSWNIEYAKQCSCKLSWGGCGNWKMCASSSRRNANATGRSGRMIQLPLKS